MGRKVSLFRSKRLQAKKRKSKLYKYVSLGALAVGLVAGLSFLTHADFVKVSSVEVDGSGIVSRTDLETIASNELSGSYAGIFSKNNFVLYPRADVEKKITDQFKAVANVSAAFDGFNKLVVKVAELEPKYFWCDSLTRDHCYFMDSRGYIFSESADFSQNILFTFYGLVDPANPVGKTYMKEKPFSEINSFVESVKLLNLTPVGLVTGDNGNGDFKLLLSNGATILFSDREPYLTTFENLEAVVHEQTRLNPDFLRQLDYIDVRFNTKAFVKSKPDAKSGI